MKPENCPKLNDCAKCEDAVTKETLKEVKKAWGRELWIVNCPKYCGKLLYLDEGAESSIHYHKEKQETFYALSGQVVLNIESKSYMLNPFSRPKTILPQTVHNFRGITDAVILEVSTHHDDSDVVRLEESKRRKVKMEKSARIAIVGESKMVCNALEQYLTAKGFQNIQHSLEQATYVFDIGGTIMGLMENVRIPADLHTQNLRHHLDIIPRAYEIGVEKLLYLATNCVYPENAPQPLKEEYLMTGKLEPISEPSSITRIIGIKMCQYFRRQYGCNFISAIPSGMHGAYDDFCSETGHVLPAMIEKMHKAKLNGDESITLFGTGTPHRDWIHVEDVADACMFLMEHYDEEEPVNIAAGLDYSIGELARIVADIVGFKGKVSWDTSRPDGARQKLLSGEKLKRIGWEPKLTTQEGVRKTYEWYKENK